MKEEDRAREDERAAIVAYLRAEKITLSQTQAHAIGFYADMIDDQRHASQRAFATPSPVIETEGSGERFWLVVHEPGCVPERKGPWVATGLKTILREFIEARPNAYLHVLRVDALGDPVIDHGPEVLQMLDGRSMSVGRKHNARTLAAHTASAERSTDREAVARIVDPEAWGERDRRAERRHYYEQELQSAIGMTFEEWLNKPVEGSLAKADAILALRPVGAENVRQNNALGGADAQPALVNEAPTGLHPAGFDQAQGDGE